MTTPAEIELINAAMLRGPPSINDLMWATLSGADASEAVNAINAYTRQYMRRESLFHMLMPPIAITDADLRPPDDVRD